MTKDHQRESVQTRNTVKKWLLEQRFSVNDGSDVHHLWGLQAIDVNQGFGFGVSQPTRNPEVISIAVTFSFEDYQNELDGLPADERGDFILELWRTINTFDVYFKGNGDPLDSVLIVGYVFMDELRRSVFWREVHSVRRAFWAALWSFEKKFRRPHTQPPIDALDFLN